jgi:DNA repair protein RecO (recombination protein O)
MSLVRLQGVVLRYRNRGEADRLLTILTPDLGKILVLARGCRRQKSRFLAFCQLFCYGELILQPYRDIFILNQAEVKNSYFDIRNDMDKLSCATYIANLTEAVATTGENNARLFKLILHSLSYISYSDRHPLELALIYELKLLEQIGYKPFLANGRFNGEIPVSSDAAETIHTILNSSTEQAQRTPMTPGARQELNRLLSRYIKQKLDLQIKSRMFLDMIP